VRGLAKAENAIGNRVAVMMVVEEPAVHLLISQRLLDLFEIHLHRKIFMGFQARMPHTSKRDVGHLYLYGY
jgi:hypothetical protein